MVILVRICTTVDRLLIRRITSLLISTLCGIRNHSDWLLDAERVEELGEVGADVAGVAGLVKELLDMAIDNGVLLLLPVVEAVDAAVAAI